MKKFSCTAESCAVRSIVKFLLMTKLAILLIFIISTQSFANVYAQGINLKLENVQLKKVFKTIEEQGVFRFVYKDAILPKEKTISIDVSNASLDEVLQRVLAKTALSYKKINDNLIVISKEATGKKTDPDAVLKVAGKITSVKGEPLGGVSILEKGTSNGATSRDDGSFAIEVNGPNSVLVFSYVGYSAKEIKVNNQVFINVILEPGGSSGLNDVIVIGYGSRQKKDIVGAVSVIGSKEVEKSTSISPELAMQGQMAGVSVTSAGGDPSARPTVRIRGVSTFNSSDPLYVIDGIPIAEGGAGATVDKVNDVTRRTPINIYTIINPSDIESITVLKDASASAIYGVRAANGVVLITTKTGKKGRVRVDVDGLYGSEKIPKTYKVLNTQQFTDFYTKAYNAYPDLNGTTPIPIAQAQYFGPVWDPSSSQYLGNSATYDWQHAIINTSAKIQNYNVRASGGSESTTYNFSLGYANNDGPFLGVNTERYSVSSNVSSRIGKYIETGLNIRLIQENLKEVPGAVTGDLGIYQAAPWQAIYDNTNPYGYAPLYKLSAPITPSTFNYTRLWGPQYVPSANYLGNLASSSNRYKNQTGIGTGYIQLEPIAGLKFKGTFSAQQYTISNILYTSFDNWQFLETPSNPYSGVPNAAAGTTPNKLVTSTGTTVNTVKSLNGDYAHLFGKHHIDATIDASEQEYTWATTSASSYVYTSDPSLRYFNAAGTEKASYLLNGHYVLIGYLGRVSYNYDTKYYLEGVIRRDGSSRFAPGHQWGTFPSASAGWRISKEEFFKDINFINDLKIRGGYGVLGNEQTTGGWEYLSVAGVNAPSYNLGSPNSNNLGIAYTSFPNASLTWEKLRSSNLGFDAALFNNKLAITVDYYHKVTKGIIQSVALSPSAGIEQNADLNIADVLNRGFEFQVAYNKEFGKIGLNLSANFTTVHNEVLSLADHTALRGAGLEEGLPIGFIYGYKVGGIFQDQTQIDKWNASAKDAISKQQAPGDIYFQNLYGQPIAGSTAHNPVKDSVVDEHDQTYLGKTIPGYYYGFSASATYLGFDLSVFFQGVGDVQKYNNARAAAESMNGYGRNQWATVLNAWTPENHSATMPRAVYTDPNNNLRASNRFVENASYLRFQNLQLGYTVPRKLLASTKSIQSIRIFISGINLFTITKYKGLDPENDNNPSTRQFLAGIKASF